MRVFALLLCGARAARECSKAEVARIPWAPYWRFELDGCTKLNLGSGALGDGGLRALVDALDSQPGQELTELKLHSNSVSDVGASILAEFLEGDEVLETLYLERNSIGDEGATALGEALEVNTRLTTLGLYGNRLGERGRAAIAKAGFVCLGWAADECQRTARAETESSASPPLAQAARTGSKPPPQPQPQPPPPPRPQPPPPQPQPPQPPQPQPPPPPPQPAPLACQAMCGHATCQQMASIGQTCDDAALFCGDVCRACCEDVLPPAPPPAPPPLAPCEDAVEGCALDGRSVCAGSPTLAARICRATCELCRATARKKSRGGSDEGGQLFLDVEAPPTVTGQGNGSDGRQMLTAALSVPALALGIAVAAALVSNAKALAKAVRCPSLGTSHAQRRCTQLALS
jgi:hypothetical protein